MAFLAVATVLAVGGYRYQRMEARNIRASTYDSIAAIGKLKADEIARWRRDVLGDANRDALSPFFRKATGVWLRDQDNPTLRGDFVERLRLEVQMSGYSEALLLNPDGRLLLAAQSPEAPIDPTTRAAVSRAFETQRSVLSDLFVGTDQAIYLDAVAPILDGDMRPLAALILRCDAKNYLYPLVQSWPTPSESAETLLVRRDGEDVLFLNELRHRSNTALRLRYPLTHSHLPAVQAALGKEGVFEGDDYREVPVLADLRRVPDSPWFVVAKVDQSEILAEIGYRTRVVMGFVVLLIGLMAAVFAFLYRHRQVVIYRELNLARQAKQKAQELLRATLLGIGDGVIATDAEARVSFMNPVAEALTGWSQSDAEGRPLAEVFSIINANTRQRCENPAERVLASGRIVGLANHTALVARDGTERQIADSGAPIRDAEGRILGVVLVFRDVTETYRMQASLVESERRVREKLDAILMPEGDLGTLDLEDLFDVPALQQLVDDFHEFTEIAVALLSLDGKVLVAAGWQDICTRFHRVHPETARHCTESDVVLSDGVPVGAWKMYHCKNHMRDMVTPIFVGGRHVGNLFLGQFLFEDEELDIETFREQARRYRFDEAEYLDAYRRVPRWSADKVESVMRFYMQLAELITKLSYSNIKLARTLSEQERAEAAVEAARDYLTNVVNAIGDPVFVKDAQHRFALVNQAHCALIGRSREEILGRTDADFFPAERAEEFRETDRRVIETGDANTNEVRVDEILTGKQRTVVTKKTRYVDPDGRPFVVGVVRDITEIRQAEQALRESEHRFRTVAEFTYDWEYWLSPSMEFVYCSPACERITGYRVEEFERNPYLLSDIAHEDDRDAIARHLGDCVEPKPDPYEFEWRIVTRSGEARWISHACQPVFGGDGKYLGRRASNRDITERKRAEQEQDRLELQLRQAQKLEAVGQLAGGIAHDFNNLLQVVLASIGTLQDSLAGNPELLEVVNDMRQAGTRAAELTRQLLAFSRRQIIQPNYLDLNELVRGVVTMFRRIIGEHIEVRFVEGQGLGAVHVDEGQIQQVLMNLCVNARDAMPTGGTLTIRTEAVSLDEEYCRDHLWASPGNYGMLSVTDTGCGMDQATREQIFEPFFTTKGIGQGTGLGLAMVYGIVKHHDGLIHVYSEVGTGTTFRIYLPMVDEPVRRPEARSAAKPKGGTEAVLLAEDEEGVRKSVARILRSAGYTVFEARDGEEAQEVFAANRNEISLAILDVIMPRLGGHAAMERIRATCPEMRFLFSSGYAEDAVHTNFVLTEGVRLITKPYSRAKLLQAVRDALDAE